MKSKIGIVILTVVGVGLLIALLVSKKAAEDQQQKDADAILYFSNQLSTANTSLDDLRQVNLILTNDMMATHQSLETASNNLTATTATLADVQAALENSQGQVTNLTGRVTDLETENKVLDERANSLSNSIIALDAQISETRKKLAAAENNNTFLAVELQRQMQEKSELQRKFNDLDEVRAQVKKLRDAEFSARRLEWINNGTSPSTQAKGAQLLMARPPSHPAKTAPANRPPQYDLDVEVGSDGSVHVVPPPTNSAAH
jgi:chromosome segregation ATPase